MPDMLVQLLKLPPLDPVLEQMRASGVLIRPARPYELTVVTEFIARHFARSWADECIVGFSNKPVTVHIALRDGALVGFSACECTRRNFFGPMGVLGSERGKGVGRALLIASLHTLADLGYAYAIVGGVGPAEFYTRAVGAQLIPDSTPGVYADPIRRPV
jgi:predicted N-acetyltransferase YhbS